MMRPMTQPPNLSQSRDSALSPEYQAGAAAGLERAMAAEAERDRLRDFARAIVEAADPQHPIEGVFYRKAKAALLEQNASQ